MIRSVGLVAVIVCGGYAVCAVAALVFMQAADARLDLGF